PIAGPTLLAMLKPMLFSVTAPGTCVRGTMSPTEACQAGALNAVPHPMRNVKSNKNHGVMSPAQAQIASATDTISMKAWELIMTIRLSTLSAIAPANTENSMTGSVMEAWTSATMLADGLMEVISQEAPTDWMRPPRLEAMFASHTDRKIG